MKKINTPCIVAIAISLLCFVLYLVINHFTPIWLDDFRYGSLGRTISDIFHTQCQDYLNFNGRVFSHASAQLYSGILPNWLFDIINALFVTLLVWLICIVAKVKVCQSLWGNVLLGIVFLLCWFTLPEQHTTMFMIAGSSNYVWASIWNLAFLYLYQQLQNDIQITKWQWPLICIFSFLAGAWTEFFAIAIGPAIVASIIINKEWKLKTILPTIFYGIGGAFVVFAPANFVRHQAIQHYPPFSTWIITQLEKFCEHHLLLVFVSIIVLVAIFKRIYQYSWRSFWHEFNIPIIAIFMTILFIFVAGVHFPRSYWVIYVMAFIVLIGLLNKISWSLHDLWSYIPILLIMFIIVTNFVYELKPCKIRYAYANEMVQQSRDGSLREGKYYLWKRTSKSRKALDIPMEPYGSFPVAGMPNYYHVPEILVVPSAPYQYLCGDIQADSTLNGFPMVDNYIIFEMPNNIANTKSLTLLYSTSSSYVLRSKLKRIVTLCKFKKLADIRLNTMPNLPLAEIIFEMESKWFSQFNVSENIDNIETLGFLEIKDKTYIALSADKIKSPIFDVLWE